MYTNKYFNIVSLDMRKSKLIYVEPKISHFIIDYNTFICYTKKTMGL